MYVLQSTELGYQKFKINHTIVKHISVYKIYVSEDVIDRTAWYSSFCKNERVSVQSFRAKIFECAKSLGVDDAMMIFYW